MAYGTPSDPVGGTVITVSWAVSNVLDPIRWLRLLTGNADPPGSAYVVVSTSTSGTSWQKVPGNALAAGAVAAHLGYVPARADGGTLTGALTVPSTLTILAVNDLGAGGRLLLQGSTTLPSGMIDNSGNAIQFYNVSDPTKTMAFGLTTGGLSMTGQIVAASADIGDIEGTSLDVGSGAISGGAITGSGVVQGTRFISTIGTGTAPFQVASTTEVANLKAATATSASTATNATNATNATTASNALALGGVAAASYGLLNSVNLASNSSDLSLTTTMQTVPGCSITAPSTGTYLVIATAWGFAQVAGGSVFAQITVAGIAVSTVRKVNQQQAGTTPDAAQYGGGMVVYTGAITSGQAVALQANSQVTSTSTIDNAQITLIRIA